MLEAATYFHQGCTVLGAIKGFEVREGEVSLRVTLRGTSHEGSLKMHSGAPETTYKIHPCPRAFQQEEVSDYTWHARKVRLLGLVESETGWVMKWQAVQPEKRGSQTGSKGNDKGRSDTKGGSKGGKDRKWGKGGPQPKGGASRRKDEVPGKACAPGA